MGPSRHEPEVSTWEKMKKSDKYGVVLKSPQTRSQFINLTVMCGILDMQPDDIMKPLNIKEVKVVYSRVQGFCVSENFLDEVQEEISTSNEGQPRNIQLNKVFRIFCRMIDESPSLEFRWATTSLFALTLARLEAWNHRLSIDLMTCSCPLTIERLLRCGMIAVDWERARALFPPERLIEPWYVGGYATPGSKPNDNYHRARPKIPERTPNASWHYGDWIGIRSLQRSNDPKDMQSMTQKFKKAKIALGLDRPGYAAKSRRRSNPNSGPPEALLQEQAAKSTVGPKAANAVHDEQGKAQTPEGNADDSANVSPGNTNRQEDADAVKDIQQQAFDSNKDAATTVEPTVSPAPEGIKQHAEPIQVNGPQDSTSDKNDGEKLVAPEPEKTTQHAAPVQDVEREGFASNQDAAEYLVSHTSPSSEHTEEIISAEESDELEQLEVDDAPPFPSTATKAAIPTIGSEDVPIETTEAEDESMDVSGIDDGVMPDSATSKSTSPLPASGSAQVQSEQPPSYENLFGDSFDMENDFEYGFTSAPRQMFGEAHQSFYPAANRQYYHSGPGTLQPFWPLVNQQHYHTTHEPTNITAYRQFLPPVNPLWQEPLFQPSSASTHTSYNYHVDQRHSNQKRRTEEALGSGNEKRQRMSSEPASNMPSPFNHRGSLNLPVRPEDDNVSKDVVDVVDVAGGLESELIAEQVESPKSQKTLVFPNVMHQEKYTNDANLKGGLTSQQDSAINNHEETAVPAESIEKTQNLTPPNHSSSSQTSATGASEDHNITGTASSETAGSTQTEKILHKPGHNDALYNLLSELKIAAIETGSNSHKGAGSEPKSKYSPMQVLVHTILSGCLTPTAMAAEMYQTLRGFGQNSAGADLDQINKIIGHGNKADKFLRICTAYTTLKKKGRYQEASMAFWDADLSENWSEFHEKHKASCSANSSDTLPQDIRGLGVVDFGIDTATARKTSGDIIRIVTGQLGKAAVLTLPRTFIPEGKNNTDGRALTSGSMDAVRSLVGYLNWQKSANPIFKEFADALQSISTPNGSQELMMDLMFSNDDTVKKAAEEIIRLLCLKLRKQPEELGSRLSWWKARKESLQKPAGSFELRPGAFSSIKFWAVLRRYAQINAKVTENPNAKFNLTALEMVGILEGNCFTEALIDECVETGKLEQENEVHWIPYCKQETYDSTRVDGLRKQGCKRIIFAFSIKYNQEQNWTLVEIPLEANEHGQTPMIVHCPTCFGSSSWIYDAFESIKNSALVTRLLGERRYIPQQSNRDVRCLLYCDSGPLVVLGARALLGYKERNQPKGFKTRDPPKGIMTSDAILATRLDFAEDIIIKFWRENPELK